MKSLRFVVYSDIHHSVERLEDTLKVEEQITNYCLENGVKLVLFLGDRFKWRNPQGWLRDIVDRKWVERLNKGIEIVTLTGQHDQYEKSGELHSYMTFNVFDKENITVVDKFLIFEFGHFILYCVSYGGFENYLKWVENSQLKKDCFNIFLMHGMIKGAKVSEESDFITDGVDRENLEDFDLVLCGDIHLPQMLEFKKTKGGYVGSVLQLTKADIGSERGFLDVTCSIDNGRKNVEWKFIKSSAPDFIEVDFDEIKNVEDYTNCFVYVKVKDLDKKKEKTLMELKKVAKQVFVIQEKEVKTELKPVVGKNIYEEIDLYLDSVSLFNLDKQKLKEYIFEKVKEL